MKKILEKVQNQKYSVRLAIFWISIILSMFLISSVWIQSFKKSASELETSELPPLKDFLKSSFQDVINK